MVETLQLSSSNDHVSVPVSQGSTNSLPERNSSTLKTFTEEAVLSFHSISYREQKKKSSLCSCKLTEKEVLSNINGTMKCGLNVIMGPHGTEKSLLLDILAGRKDPRGISGDVLINGVPQTANFKYNSGYVAQDDMVMNTLTVRDNLEFSAALRLPTTVTNEGKSKRINEVIKLLRLEKVEDAKARSKEVRRRTSIAMELITDHPFLFLDEPTTGLDWSAANDVMRLLKRVSHLGRTIIFSIHQPQYSIFRLFDSLTLLASGKLIFHGPAQEALQHFESVGYYCEQYCNPADFLLDVIYGYVPAVMSNGEGEHHEAKKTIKNVTEDRISKLAELYAKSTFCKETQAKLDQFSEGQKEKLVSAFRENEVCSTSCWHQLRWIIWRSFRSVQFFSWTPLTQLILTAILAVIVGVTFLILRNDCTEIWTRTGLLFLLVAFLCLRNVSAGQLFVTDKKRFLHEHISGYYKITPYFFGKVLSEFLPRRLLPSVVFAVVVYSIAGLKTVKGYFGMIFTVVMVAYSASSASLCIGAGGNAVTVPTLIMALYFVLMLFFSGLSLYFGYFVPELWWLRSLSIPHYGLMMYWGRILDIAERGSLPVGLLEESPDFGLYHDCPPNDYLPKIITSNGKRHF